MRNSGAGVQKSVLTGLPAGSDVQSSRTRHLRVGVGFLQRVEWGIKGSQGAYRGEGRRQLRKA